jgi:hypothetical protein
MEETITDMVDDAHRAGPDVRPVREIREIMRGMADDCEGGAVADVPEVFRQALSLMLEMRVPRMPDTEDDLRRMLDDAVADTRPGMSGEDVMAEMREHGVVFQRFLADYREALSVEDWAQAAEMLTPGNDYGAVSWEAGPYGCETETVGTHTRFTIERADGEVVVAVADDEGLARLAGLLRAHGEWKDMPWRMTSCAPWCRRRTADGSTSIPTTIRPGCRRETTCGPGPGRRWA